MLLGSTVKYEVRNCMLSAGALQYTRKVFGATGYTRSTSNSGSAGIEVAVVFTSPGLPPVFVLLLQLPSPMQYTVVSINSRLQPPAFLSPSLCQFSE